MDYGKSSVSKKYKIFGLAIILLFVQFNLTAYQLFNYEPHVYDCSDMSKEFEQFFERIGIDTYIVQGIRDDGPNHVWILLDTGLIPIEIETTMAMPISPRMFNKYDNIRISDGYINNDTSTGEIVFKDW